MRGVAVAEVEGVEGVEVAEVEVVAGGGFLCCFLCCFLCVFCYFSVVAVFAALISQ